MTTEATGRQQLLARWAGQPAQTLLAALGVDPATQLTLPGLLERSVARFADAPAIVTPTTSTSYAELAHRSAAFAHLLAELHPQDGARVALLLPNGPQFVVALHGAARAGAASVLLNSFGTAAEISGCLERSGARLLVTTSRLAPELLEFVRALAGIDSLVSVGLQVYPVGKRIGFIDWVVVLDDDAVLDREPAPERAAVGPEQDAALLFTSGSTGMPKAVLHSHRAICLQSYRYSDLLRLTPDDRLMSLSPYFWSSGLCKSLGAALSSGATLLAMPRFNAESALAFLERERATKLISPVHLDHQMVSHPKFGDLDLSALRGVHRRSPLRDALGITERWSPGGYGLSEMCTLVSSFPADIDPEQVAGSEGWVVPGAEVKVTDPDTEQTVPFGEVGRICVRGDSLMIRYDDQPLPFDEEGFFPTSDLGLLDEEGRLYFRGRADSVIRSGGTNVSPVEVENALTGWHRLRRVAAVAVPHPDRGEVLILCAVPADDTVDEAEVTAYLRTLLSGYKVPRRVVLVDESRLKFTPTHKVDLGHARRIVIHELLDREGDPAWLELLTGALE
ncbi:AMP-dependent synthetase [Acrocarpospora pleiomorpha]|uniref:AMP-dependent synthetase n=1 Tax=Acrocarpospora pleiomorpha TaxID=90975 RepID=A0A5M3XXR1_9ACTN|nr:class I adenylate-forming enzyme family protein [Acrocarpospora pleiomorpha]GES25782.1 AMP-dependent synthetase [Acrocarpospora pleiomorpha]